MSSINNAINYFYFDSLTKRRIKKRIEEFNIFIPQTINTKHKSMHTIYGAAFLSDIINYYNSDLALTAGICTSLIFNSKTEKKICYHLENYFFRLISCWDYIFIGLNEYLHTELIASHNIKQKIIDENFLINIPIEIDGGYIKLFQFPKSEEEKKEIEKKLKKELKVLNPANLKEAINKKYEINENIKQIFELYTTEPALQSAKVIRNSIIHSDNLTKDFTFGVSDLFKSQTITSKPTDDTRQKVALVSINMQILKKAIESFKEIIMLDLFPNRIEDESRQYYIQAIKCKDCKKEEILTADFVETLNGDYFCRYCDSKNAELLEKVKVSQPYYEQVLIKFIEDAESDYAQLFDV